MRICMRQNNFMLAYKIPTATLFPFHQNCCWSSCWQTDNFIKLNDDDDKKKYRYESETFLFATRARTFSSSRVVAFVSQSND